MHGLHARIRKLEKAADGREAVRKGLFSITWDRDVIEQIRRYNVRLTTIDRKRYYKSDTGNKLSKSEIDEVQQLKDQISKLYRVMGMPNGYEPQAAADLERMLALQTRQHDRRWTPLTGKETKELEELIYRRYSSYETAPKYNARTHYNELLLRQLNPRLILTENERKELERLHKLLNKRNELQLVFPYGRTLSESKFALDIEKEIRSASVLVAGPSTLASWALRRKGFEDVDFATDALAMLDRMTHHLYDLVMVDVDLQIPYEGKLLPRLKQRFPTVPILKVIRNADEATDNNNSLLVPYQSQDAASAVRKTLLSSREKR
jgi:CheY-like chemotaxis protein